MCVRLVLSRAWFQRCAGSTLAAAAGRRGREEGAAACCCEGSSGVRLSNADPASFVSASMLLVDCSLRQPALTLVLQPPQWQWKQPCTLAGQSDSGSCCGAACGLPSTSGRGAQTPSGSAWGAARRGGCADPQRKCCSSCAVRHQPPPPLCIFIWPPLRQLKNCDQLQLRYQTSALPPLCVLIRPPLRQVDNFDPACQDNEWAPGAAGDCSGVAGGSVRVDGLAGGCSGGTCPR